MEPRRRQLIELAALGGIASLGGCVDVPRGNGNSNNQGSDSNNATSDGGANESQQENQTDESSEEDDLSPTASTFNQQIDSVVEFLEWHFGDGYRDAYRDYDSSITSALSTFGYLYDTDLQELTVGDITELENQLNQAKSAAYDQFAPYYRYHFDWADFIPEVVRDLENNLRRSESELFKQRVDEFRSDLNSAHNIDAYYPDFKIGTIEPYERFLNSTGDESSLFNGFIFEGAHLLSDPDPFFIFGENNIRFDQNPFGIQRGGDDEFRRSVIDERETSLIKNAQWFSSPEEVSNRFLLNIVDYSKIHDSYPGTYSYDDPDLRFSDVYTTNMNRCTEVGVSIQVFDSTDTASDVYDSLLSQATVDGSVEYHGVEYDQVFSVGEDQTYYVSLVQVGNYIIGLNPITTPWENHEIIYDPINSDEVAYSLTDITSGSFIDPNTTGSSE